MAGNTARAMICFLTFGIVTPYAFAMASALLEVSASTSAAVATAPTALATSAAPPRLRASNYTWTEKEDDDLTPMTKENITLDELKRTWMARLGENCMFISAKEKLNIDEFRETIYRKVRELHVQKYPYNDFLYMDVE